MKQSTQIIFQELFARYPALTCVKGDIQRAFSVLEETYRRGGTVFVCGNGGSAADCEHIVGELMKSFLKPRKMEGGVLSALTKAGEEGEYLASTLEGALPAVSLVSQTGILTAFANDRAWDASAAQQLYGLARKGDALIVLSTSGNSKNCAYACMVANAKGVNSVALTGKGGGRLKELSTVTVCVPEEETYKIQELHLPVYHCLCAMLEEELF